LTVLRLRRRAGAVSKCVESPHVFRRGARTQLDLDGPPLIAQIYQQVELSAIAGAQEGRAVLSLRGREMTEDLLDHESLPARSHPRLIEQSLRV